MISIVVKNSTSHLHNLPMHMFKDLRELMSYSTTPVYSYYKKFYGQKVSLLSKKGEFPTGLLYIVIKYLDSSGVYYTRVEERIEPKNDTRRLVMNLPKGMHFYSEQVEIASYASRRHRGIICAPTGFGKSIAMALLIKQLQVKTLVIVPTLELKRQLIRSFTDYFGSLEYITIENIDSAALKNHKDFDCLIIDEAHHVAAKTYRKLNKMAWNNIYYRFFFTATPFRSRTEEQLLFESIAGQIIYKVDYKTAVEKGYIVPLEAYYVEVPKVKINSKSWPEVYSTLCVKNEIRNTLISQLITTIVKSKRSILCLVKEIQHGNTLSESTGISFASGINENTESLIKEHSLGRSIGLIGTTGVLGEGVDTKACEYVVIAGLGKSRNALMQQIGRGFRNFPGKQSCKVIIFCDPSHKWTKEHFKSQCNTILEEYGVVPIKLVI